MPCLVIHNTLNFEFIYSHKHNNCGSMWYTGNYDYTHTHTNRYVCGMREVLKHLKSRRVKCLIVAPNMDRIQSEGGIDDVIGQILSLAEEQGIPIIFAMSRRRLALTLKKTHKVGCVGVFRYEGAEVSGCHDYYSLIINVLSYSVLSYLHLTPILLSHTCPHPMYAYISSHIHHPHTSLTHTRRVTTSGLLELVEEASEHYKTRSAGLQATTTKPPLPLVDSDSGEEFDSRTVNGNETDELRNSPWAVFFNQQPAQQVGTPPSDMGAPFMSLDKGLVQHSLTHPTNVSPAPSHVINVNGHVTSQFNVFAKEFVPVSLNVNAPEFCPEV